MSIAFDRAVEYYDQTRMMPSEPHGKAIEALIHETGVTSGSRVLEVGVGTGRIALSVAERIQHIYGIDLSLEMMQVLKRKLAGVSTHVDLAQGNALQLPFEDEWFDLVYMVHVLHLVDGWHDAITEAMRVLKTGGFYVVSFHKRNGESPGVQLRRQLDKLVSEYGISTKRPGAQSEDEIFEEIKRWDAEPRLVEAVAWSEPSTPAQILADLDRQIFSETWAIPRAVMDEVMPPLREWAKEKFGELDREIETTYAARWLIVEKNKSA